MSALAMLVTDLRDGGRLSLPSAFAICEGAVQAAWDGCDDPHLMLEALFAAEDHRHFGAFFAANLALRCGTAACLVDPEHPAAHRRAACDAIRAVAAAAPGCETLAALARSA